jgi:hypothetical protein
MDDEGEKLLTVSRYFLLPIPEACQLRCEDSQRPRRVRVTVPNPTLKYHLQAGDILILSFHSYWEMTSLIKAIEARFLFHNFDDC